MMLPSCCSNPAKWRNFSSAESSADFSSAFSSVAWAWLDCSWERTASSFSLQEKVIEMMAIVL
jgi:hypothetical protein